MYLFIYLLLYDIRTVVSCWHFWLCPPKICHMNCIFNEKLILIIMRVMSLTLIHIYSHMHIDTWSLQQREWFTCWPCGCKKESWSPVTHIDWRSCFGGASLSFPPLFIPPFLSASAPSRFLLHLSAEISAVIRDWDWWQSQHAPCYII